MTKFSTLAALMMTALIAAGSASAADQKFGADRHIAMDLRDLPRPRQGQSGHARHQDLHAVPQHQGSR